MKSRGHDKDFRNALTWTRFLGLVHKHRERIQISIEIDAHMELQDLLSMEIILTMMSSSYLYRQDANTLEETNSFLG